MKHFPRVLIVEDESAIAELIAVNLRQAWNLTRDIDWLEQFRRSDPERRQASAPRLLAQIAG